MGGMARQHSTRPWPALADPGFTLPTGSHNLSAKPAPERDTPKSVLALCLMLWSSARPRHPADPETRQLRCGL